MKNRFMTFVCASLILSTAVSSTASAAVIGSSQALATAQAAQNRAQVLQMVERDDVASVLQGYGISAGEAKQRVAALSDDEVSRLKSEIDSLPAGQGAVGAVVGAILIIFLVLLLTDVLGETDVYNFDD